MSKKPVKTKAKARSAAKPDMNATVKDQTVSIRKIANGYITRKSGMEGKGPGAKYTETEVFSKGAPIVKVPK